jgi:hypothetical protein
MVEHRHLTHADFPLAAIEVPAVEPGQIQVTMMLDKDYDPVLRRKSDVSG